MWPRSEEERLRKKLSGFVSFFRREDANEARIQLHEEVVCVFFTQTSLSLFYRSNIRSPPSDLLSFFSLD
jgi:hypothetical protein